MAKHLALICYLALLRILCVNAQPLLGLGCPLQWDLYGVSCYQFVFDKTKSYDDAASACWVQGSALVSVNDVGENRYITQFLERHGQQSMSEWYTSGQLIGNIVKWNGDGGYSNDTTVINNVYWNAEKDTDPINDRIIYKFESAIRRFGWSKSPGRDVLNYICEIPKSEVYRLIQQERDFDFGLPNIDAANVPKGPAFLTVAENVVVVEEHIDGQVPLFIDCVANGHPQPDFHWFVKNTLSGSNENDYKMISTATSTRYTFANGRLTITTPSEKSDAGVYRCKAENSQGSIISVPVMVSFGYLNNFSPNQQGFVSARLNQGTFISCKAPNAKPEQGAITVAHIFKYLAPIPSNPVDLEISMDWSWCSTNEALSYTWYKDNIRNFIRPELNKYYFMSANGNLYLSEVQLSDAGNYYCVVTLVPRVGERLSTTQPPSGTSKAIELRVMGNNPLDYGPIIHPDFIAVYPKPPMVGHDVRLECFAYGKLPLKYSWSREGKNFPPGTRFLYEDRVLIIPNAQFSDGGNYTCKVLKLTGKRNIAIKSIMLNLEAKPYFVNPLRNVHADIGSKLTWRCEARAIPRVTYTWYINSTILTGTPGEVEVKENVLVIKRLDKSRDEGMYQCEAKNQHGIRKTSAELRVLSIKPSFQRYPLPSSRVASQGGNLTLHCRPEAAPQPEITWLHNGQGIGYGDARREILLDGTLHVMQVVQSDRGRYTCKAKNTNGEDQSSTMIIVMAGVRFQKRPMDQTVQVNKTAFLYCDASYDYKQYDLAYVWKFNGREISTHYDPFYRDGIRENLNGLYIINAQYRHGGMYECLAETVMLSISAKAMVYVKGPPSEPAGVYVEQGSGYNGTVRIMWTWNPAADHGYPVQFFDIEAITEYSSNWTHLAMDIPQHLTIVPLKNMKRFFEIKNLLPYNSYRFRVRATNGKGIGPSSRPSNIYHVPAAAPTKAPTVINQGGGAVGLLKIGWQPLSRAEEGGLGFGYNLFWRLASETNKAFRKEVLRNVTGFYKTVGLDNYYLLYTVRVQAYNKHGSGPMSDYASVYSAEGIPTVRPKNVRYNPINGTALQITWNPVSNVREVIKGRVRGYRIDYYEKNTQTEPCALCSTFVYGDVGQGNIIGLIPNGDYWVRLTVFNGAGISTVSEQYLCSTYEAPPGRFPQLVDIYSHGEHSALVKWRGVNIIQGEATLDGYKLMYWPVGDDIRTANFTLTDKVNEAVVYGLQIDIIYKLRVMGTSRGGDGKKSPTVYFTVLKGGSININRASFDPATSEVQVAAAVRVYCSYLILCISLLLVNIVQ